MRIITEQTKTNPVLTDVAIEAAKAELLNLAWLNQSFGRAWPIPMRRGDKDVIEPCVYTGNGNEYETLVPSADLGNYTFFVLTDSGRVTSDDSYIQPFALILWYDMTQCFDNGNNRRDVENLKADILDVLLNVPVKNGGFRVLSVKESPKAVYKEFVFDAQSSQALVQPYGAIRFEGEIVSLLGCYN